MYVIRAEEYGDESVLRYVESKPPIPGAGEVRVRLHAAGVNPADTYVITGTNAFSRPNLPFTPGWDGAGVIDEVGPEVSSYTVGERVYVAALPIGSTGTYAQHVVANVASVHPLPDSLSFQHGAAIGIPYMTAVRALIQRGGAQAGETVLIHGASGGVGVPTVHLARSLGLVIIGTAGSEAGRELVRVEGAQHVLDHTQDNYLDQVSTLTNGRGVDLIVEMLANKNLEKDFAVLAQCGRIVVVGSRGSLNFTPRKTMIAEADVRGTALWNMQPSDIAAANTEIAQRLAEGTLRPSVGRIFPLSGAADAHRYLMGSHAHGKVILDCT